MDRSLQMDEGCEDIVSCVMLQKMTSAQEEFNNQVDKMTVLWTVSLFPRTSLSLFNGHMNKVALVAEMGVMFGLNNMDFHLPRVTWLQLHARSANIRGQH